MKVLFVGFGSIAQKHFQALRSLRPNTTIYALKSGNQSSEDSRIIDLYHWAEVPLDLNFAIISNPTFKHTEVLERLIEYSIPLFIEKPISHRLEGLNKLAAQIKQSGVISYVACNLRFLPVMQYLKTELLPTVSNIEEVSVYCGSFLPDWRPGKDFKKIYSANEEMGGGVHLDLFHELDYTYWLFGMPQRSFCTLRNNSSLCISAIDYAHYQFLYASFTSCITLNYYRRDTKRTIEIVTSETTYAVNLLNNSIIDSEGNSIFEGQTYTINNTYYDTYISQMKYFLGMLEGANPPFNTFLESLKILEICLESEKIS